jgi:hypothetical protein
MSDIGTREQSMLPYFEDKILGHVRELPRGAFVTLGGLSMRYGVPEADIEPLLRSSEFVRRPWQQPDLNYFTSIEHRVSAREVVGALYSRLADL